MQLPSSGRGLHLTHISWGRGGTWSADAAGRGPVIVRSHLKGAECEANLLQVQKTCTPHTHAHTKPELELNEHTLLQWQTQHGDHSPDSTRNYPKFPITPRGTPTHIIFPNSGTYIFDHHGNIVKITQLAKNPLKGWYMARQPTEHRPHQCLAGCWSKQ